MIGSVFFYKIKIEILCYVGIIGGGGGGGGGNFIIGRLVYFFLIKLVDVLDFLEILNNCNDWLFLVLVYCVLVGSLNIFM